MEMKTEEEATVTRLGRSGIYVVPKGETGKLTLTQEGAQKQDDGATERMFLGDAVVVCGTQKKTLVLLPAGQTWFEWAEGQKLREELRALELQTLGGHALDEDQTKRMDELRVQVQAGQDARAAAAAKALSDAAADADRKKAEQQRKKDKQAPSAARSPRPTAATEAKTEIGEGLPPPPPRDVAHILGEKPPEFPEGACGRMPRPPEVSLPAPPRPAPELGGVLPLPCPSPIAAPRLWRQRAFGTREGLRWSLGIWGLGFRV